MNFKDFELKKEILKAIEEKGFEKPSEIQERVIPLFLETEKDILGQAQTGTGKTAAFGLPILSKIDTKLRKTQAIILAPTRELAIQVGEELQSFGKYLDLNLALLYGGQYIGNELRKLKTAPQIIVGTPGRVKDHLSRGSLKLDEVKYFVLDEADEMLNIGFREEIEEILKFAPKEKQVLLFSATMPRGILEIAKTYMKDYEIVSVKKETVTNSSVNQIYFQVSERNRFEALCRILDMEEEFYGIIFTRTKLEADEISGKLKTRGYEAEAIHSDIDQKRRENILKKFKSGKTTILAATDVAARGLDINDLTHVINYNLPENAESYTHRIGRTGRAGKSGVAINFVSPSEYRKLFLIERITKAKMEKRQVPNASEMTTYKKNKLVSDLEKNLADLPENYLKISEELLKLGSEKEVIAALLKKYFSLENIAGTADLNEEFRENSNMMSRLFIAKGRADGMSQESLKEFLSKETNIDFSNIQSLEIFDNFSFMNVPLQDAEIILKIFKDKNRMKPLVVKAKSKDQKSSGNSSSGGYRGKRNFGDNKSSGERKSFGRKREY